MGFLFFFFYVCIYILYLGARFLFLVCFFSLSSFILFLTTSPPLLVDILRSHMPQQMHRVGDKMIPANLGSSSGVVGGVGLKSRKRRRKRESRCGYGRSHDQVSAVEYQCAECDELYAASVTLNPWWCLRREECPKCHKSQIPRIDISLPSNAIDYHPALLAHEQDEDNEGGHHHLVYKGAGPLDDGNGGMSLGVVHGSQHDEDDTETDSDTDDDGSDEFGESYSGPKFTPEEARKIVVLLDHARNCPGRHKSPRHREVCQSAKYMMLHVRDCNGTTCYGDECPRPWCRKLKHLLFHMLSCEDPRNCGYCGPGQFHHDSNYRQLDRMNRVRLEEEICRFNERKRREGESAKCAAQVREGGGGMGGIKATQPPPPPHHHHHHHHQAVQNAAAAAANGKAHVGSCGEGIAQQQQQQHQPHEVRCGESHVVRDVASPLSSLDAMDVAIGSSASVVPVVAPAGALGATHGGAANTGSMTIEGAGGSIVPGSSSIAAGVMHASAAGCGHPPHYIVPPVARAIVPHPRTKHGGIRDPPAVLVIQDRHEGARSAVIKRNSVPSPEPHDSDVVIARTGVLNEQYIKDPRKTMSDFVKYGGHVAPGGGIIVSENGGGGEGGGGGGGNVVSTAADQAAEGGQNDAATLVSEVSVGWSGDGSSEESSESGSGSSGGLGLGDSPKALCDSSPSGVPSMKGSPIAASDDAAKAAAKVGDAAVKREEKTKRRRAPRRGVNLAK